MPIVPLRNFGKYGVVADSQDQALPIGTWSDARNVRFSGLSMEKMLEPALEMAWDSDTNGQPQWLQGWSDGLATYFALATATKLWFWKASTSSNGEWVEAGGPYEEGQWQSFEWGDTVIFNNGNGAPQVFDQNTLSFIDLPNWGLISTADDITNNANPSKDTAARCTCIVPLKGFLVALGITESGVYQPNTVWWSDSTSLAGLSTKTGGGPPSWDYESPSTLSGKAEVGVGSGALAWAEVLNENLICYADASATAMQVTGGRTVMSFRRLFNKGCAGLNLAAEFNNQHFVVARDQLYVHDGSTVHLIAKDRVEEEFFKRAGKGGRFGGADIDFTTMQVVKNPDRKEISVVFNDLGISPGVACDPYSCSAFGSSSDGNATFFEGGSKTMPVPEYFIASDGSQSSIRFLSAFAGRDLDINDGKDQFYASTVSSHTSSPDLCSGYDYALGMGENTAALPTGPRMWVESGDGVAFMHYGGFSSTSNGIDYFARNCKWQVYYPHNSSTSNGDIYFDIAQGTGNVDEGFSGDGHYFGNRTWTGAENFTHFTIDLGTPYLDEQGGNFAWFVPVNYRVTINGVEHVGTRNQSMSSYQNPAPQLMIAPYMTGEISLFAGIKGVLYGAAPTSAEYTVDDAYIGYQQNFSDYSAPEYCSLGSRSALVYNFEDNNYTWMDASIDGARPFPKVACMHYAFDPGWVVRWSDLDTDGATWDGSAGTLITATTKWSDFYHHGTEKNLYWLAEDGVYRSDQAVKTDGVKEYFVERVGIDLDDLNASWTTNKMKHLKQFYFHAQSPTPVTGANNFDFTVGWAKTLMDSPDWEPSVTVSLQDSDNTGDYKADFRTTGRYLSINMNFNTTAEVKMSGGDMDASESHGR